MKRPSQELFLFLLLYIYIYRWAASGEEGDRNLLLGYMGTEANNQKANHSSFQFFPFM